MGGEQGRPRHGQHQASGGHARAALGEPRARSPCSPASRRWCACRCCSTRWTRRAAGTPAAISAAIAARPLGGFDKELRKQAKRLAAANVVFEPGLNEDLAATAIWGTQQIALSPAAPSAKACSASGTARGRAWTAPATCCATPTAPAPRPAAACWRWPATIRRPNPPPSPMAPNTPSSMSRCPMLDPAGVAEVLEFGLKAPGDVALRRPLGRHEMRRRDHGRRRHAAASTPPPMPRASPSASSCRPTALHVRPGDTRHRAGGPAARSSSCRPRWPSPAPTASTGWCWTARMRASASSLRGKAYCDAPPGAARCRHLRRHGPRPRACASGRSAWPGRWMPRPPAPSPEGWRRCWWSRTAAPCWSRSSATRSIICPSAPARGRQDATSAAARCCPNLTELDAGAGPARARRAPARGAAHRAVARPHRRAGRAGRRRRAAPLHERDALFLPGLPAQHLDQGAGGQPARWPASAATTSRKFMDRETEAFTQMGGEGTPWLGMMHFVERRARLRQYGRRHLRPFRQPGGPRRRGRQGRP